MQPVIIAIAGASGSGKTYFSRLLQNELNVFAIVSYTTRPKRVEETDGQDYYFISDRRTFPFCDMLTYTKFYNYEYFALRDQVPPQGFCSYVVDENGVQVLREMYENRYRIVTVLVRSRHETLIERGIDPMRIYRDNQRKQLAESYFDFVIDNDGTLEEFENGIREIYKQILRWLYQ